MSEVPAALSWARLPWATRHALEGKLNGLYERAQAAEAFDYLAVDKQHALLLVWRRFAELGLWPHLRQVENAYGEGGVGLNFTAWPSFLETLRWHPSFTARLAKNKENDGGFRELRARRGGLHLLYKNQSDGRRWNAHFDMYNPLFSPANTARHIWNEVIKSQRPNWQMVEGWLKKR